MLGKEDFGPRPSTPACPCSRPTWMDREGLKFGLRRESLGVGCSWWSELPLTNPKWPTLRGDVHGVTQALTLQTGGET